MRKIKLAVAAAAVAAGMLASPLAAGTANASTYTISYINRCAEPAAHPNVYDCIQLGAHSTKTDSQIWINGSVICHPYSGSVTYSWCGVGGGNGTGALNIGVNFTFSGITGLYERMDIFAGPDRKCNTWGSNSDTNGIDYWWNADLTPICEQPA
jgi:hypothetical protein